jgi:putative transposase
MGHTRRMNPSPATNPYKRHRFPPEIIGHCVWLYFRFCLSYRDVEELMAARGVLLTYEAVRYWCQKFGQAYANQLRRQRPRPGDTWHMDEIFLTIMGEWHYLWQAVDQDGNILDILMQRFKSPGHAQRFLAAYGPIVLHFRPKRHRLPARVYRQEMTQQFQSWREITGMTMAA